MSKIKKMSGDMVAVDRSANAEERPSAYEVRVFEHGDALVAIPTMGAYSRHHKRYGVQHSKPALLYPSLDAYHNFIIERDRSQLVGIALHKLDRMDIEALGLTKMARTYGIG